VDTVVLFRDEVLRLAASTQSVWTVDVVESTGSTNTDLVARVRAGLVGDYAVLVALDQAQGKGRLSRTWDTPGGEAVAMSMAVPLDSLGPSWGLIPIATGIAVVRAIANFGVRATLKWPNDVFIHGKKVCGILVEVVERTAVIGVGINVLQTQETIGYPTAISLSMAGAGVEREQIVAAVLKHLSNALSLLTTDLGRIALVEEYRRKSHTLGTTVRVYIDEQTYEQGEAVDIAPDGQLIVRINGEPRPFASGDVVGVREDVIPGRHPRAKTPGNRAPGHPAVRRDPR